MELEFDGEITTTVKGKTRIILSEGEASQMVTQAAGMLVDRVIEQTTPAKLIEATFDAQRALLTGLGFATETPKQAEASQPTAVTLHPITEALLDSPFMPFGFWRRALGVPRT